MPPISDALVLTALLAGTGTAAAVDVAQRRIPNPVSGALAAAGVVLAVTGLSGVTVGSSLLGFVLGFALMLPGHLFGALGAGDVKLFAAAGAVLGAARLPHAFVFVALAGGVSAVVVSWWRGRLGRTLLQTARLCGSPSQARAAIEAPQEDNRFPYGPAIAAGCILAVLG